MKYRLFIKRPVCQEGCLKCEVFPGFKDTGEFCFNEWVLLDVKASEVLARAIINCPVGALGWEKVEAG